MLFVCMCVSLYLCIFVNVCIYIYVYDMRVCFHLHFIYDKDTKYIEIQQLYKCNRCIIFAISHSLTYIYN